MSVQPSQSGKQSPQDAHPEFPQAGGVAYLLILHLPGGSIREFPQAGGIAYLLIPDGLLHVVYNTGKNVLIKKLIIRIL